MFRDLSHWVELATSAQLLVLIDFVALFGIATAMFLALRNGRAARAGDGTETVAAASGWGSRLPILLMTAAMLLHFGWFATKWVEVNHFPSQTMSEVLVMFTLGLATSMVVLHYALGLKRRGAGWAVLDDMLIALVFVGVFFTHHYLRGLTTLQRDLPPALQSYWFPPHLVALIFSYATMGIAALICLAYFVTRFWSGVFGGGRSWKSQVLIALCLVLVPFAHVVTLPVFALAGLVFFWLARTGRLPTTERVVALEKELDDVSFRAFAVGMPFLTGGLWMGAFWAQEAWANYWGWDSKENAALISWLVYVVYIHLRMLGGYRGEKAMAVLMGGALSVFVTFQIFGYLPDSQKSMHRYTDDGVKPREGQQGGVQETESARAPEPPEGVDLPAAPENR